VDVEWRDEYGTLAGELTIRYFGRPPRLPRSAAYEREDYPWNIERRGMVVDSRGHAKNSAEYHTLEDHAWQYHVTAQYEQAYHYWLMAASHRRDDAELISGEPDPGHGRAIRFCLRHALFNQALAAAQRSGGPWPTEVQFGIDPVRSAADQDGAQAVLDAVHGHLSEPG